MSPKLSTKITPEQEFRQKKNFQVDEDDDDDDELFCRMIDDKRH